ncbi:WD domain-containing protein [Pleurostoma richardsiae]|uniref:Pre-rRNA-processing protein IPI3 n=1 Tax=Pleurostoma richardsiae TaxID=41990 RepID=A0AA38S3L9_9PEZI|nr:WD domain-containing protein [Pleurostoma richardsiae]
MLVEEFFSAICGPPLASNTAISKDVGIYAHTLWPSYAAKSSFKKSQTPPNCLVANETHVFAAQNDRAYVHVYSRMRGNQEAFVPFTEKIRCLTLAGDGTVLVLGSAEGRVMLWETCTGRLVTTPATHVQAVSCLAATPYHLLTGSEDSNVHVWNLTQLLELGSTAEFEPERRLSNHRGAITGLVAGQGINPDTSICVSASRDKTCIIWNYQTGVTLRTLLFPSSPLCIALDPCSRALYVSSEDGSIFSIGFFGTKALLGPQSDEAASTVVQVSQPFGAVPSESRPATCLGVSYDGSVLLSGHPKGQIHLWNLGDSGANSSIRELGNLNAAVTNIVFVSPLSSEQKPTKPWTVVKPTQAEGQYTLTTQFEADFGTETRFNSMLETPGFSQEVLESAILSLQQPSAPTSGREEDMQRQIDELWEIINQQRALQKETVQRLAEHKSNKTARS